MYYPIEFDTKFSGSIVPPHPHSSSGRSKMIHLISRIFFLWRQCHGQERALAFDLHLFPLDSSVALGFLFGKVSITISHLCKAVVGLETSVSSAWHRALHKRGSVDVRYY